MELLLIIVNDGRIFYSYYSYILYNKYINNNKRVEIILSRKEGKSIINKKVLFK